MRRPNAIAFSRHEKPKQILCSVAFAPCRQPLSLRLSAAFCASARAAAQAPVPDSPAIEAKAHAMLAKLTLEQKIELLGGVESMFTHAIAGHRPAALQDVRRLGGRAHLGTDHRLCRRRGAGRHLGPRLRAQARREPGQGCPRPQRQLPARPRRQHRPLARSPAATSNISPKIPS